MKTSRHPENSRGFTMVEVLVALAISGMMGVVIVSSYLNVMSAYEAVNANPRLDLDVRFARNALLAEPDFETAQTGDQFEGASGRQITWSSVIEATMTADLYQVTFICEVGPGKNQGETGETITEVFRLIRPTWSQTQNLGIDVNTLRSEARDRILEMQQPSPLSGLSGNSSLSGGMSGGSGSSGSAVSGGGASGGAVRGGAGGGQGSGRGGATGGGTKGGGGAKGGTGGR